MNDDDVDLDWTDVVNDDDSFAGVEVDVTNPGVGSQDIAESQVEKQDDLGLDTALEYESHPQPMQQDESENELTQEYEPMQEYEHEQMQEHVVEDERNDSNEDEQYFENDSDYADDEMIHGQHQMEELDVEAATQEKFQEGDESVDYVDEGEVAERGYEFDDQEEGVSTTSVHADRVDVQKVSLADVLVKIEFNVGVIEMTRSNLNSLKVDDVVELGGDGNGIVSVTVGSNEIATGRIVSVNDQLAIQLTSIGI